MSELISGKEAYFAIGDGKTVQKKFRENPYGKFGDWEDLDPSDFYLYGMLRDSGNDPQFNFRLKQKTITINGIEVPAPFEPKKGEQYFYLTDGCDGGYGVHNHDGCTIEIAAWRTEEEIKQVVAALRSIFNAK